MNATLAGEPKMVEDAAKESVEFSAPNPKSATQIKSFSREDLAERATKITRTLEQILHHPIPSHPWEFND